MGTLHPTKQQQCIGKHQWLLNFSCLVFCSALAAPPQCRGTTSMSWKLPSGQCHSSSCVATTWSTCLVSSVETLEVKAWQPSSTSPSTHLPSSTQDEENELELWKSGAPPSPDRPSARD